MEVSVIIPVYNAVDYIDQSIRSALIQPEVQEVLVIDDGSTDGSYERLEEWEDKEPRIKLLFHPNRERKRAAAARNLGLKHAKSEWIAFLDADDYYLPNRFLYTRQTIRINPGTDVVFEAVKIIIQNDSTLSMPKDDVLMMKKIPSNRIFQYCLLSQKGDICPNGLTFKRSLLLKTGLMDERLLQKEDKDFILRLSLFGSVSRGIANRMPVAIYRYHQFNTISDIEEREKYVMQLHKKWIRKINLLPLTIWGKLTFVRQYMVSKNNTFHWPFLKKVITYPFLFINMIDFSLIAALLSKPKVDLIKAKKDEL
jgi:glycosyltransferase involved in cell wall biosynthesis